MLDYMESCLQQFYRDTKWPEDDCYTRLNSASRALLDFQVAHGFALNLGKPVSPFLKSSWTLSQLAPNSVSFLYTSTPLKAPSNRIREEISALELRAQERVLRHAGAVEGKPKTSRELLVYGRLFEDGKLEGLFAQRLGKSVLWSVSGYNLWNRSPASVNYVENQLHLSSQLQYASPRVAAELSYSGASNVFGITGVANVARLNASTVWNVGSEAYYAAAEKSGGFSLGCKCTALHACVNRPPFKVPIFSELLVTANPVMGHLATAFVTSVSPTTLASVRYDLNVYSFESDISVGYELRSGLLAEHAQGRELESSSPLNSHLVKFRLSPKKGIACKIEGQYKRTVWSVGVCTDFGPHIRKMIGFSLQIGQ